MDNIIKCNIKEPHSHLVAGKSFDCEMRRVKPDCTVCGREGGHMGGVPTEHTHVINDPMANEAKKSVEEVTTKDDEIRSRLAVTDKNIDQLRQWLNEDRIDDFKKMITNEDIKFWLDIK